MNQQLLVLAANTATAHGLDVKLVCAVVEQESGWDTWAIRYERNFDKVYVANHGFGDTEEIGRVHQLGTDATDGRVRPRARLHRRSFPPLRSRDRAQLGLQTPCCQAHRARQRHARRPAGLERRRQPELCGRSDGPHPDLRDCGPGRGKRGKGSLKVREDRQSRRDRFRAVSLICAIFRFRATHHEGGIRDRAKTHSAVSDRLERGPHVAGSDPEALPPSALE